MPICHSTVSPPLPDEPSSSRIAAVPPPIQSLSPTRDAMQSSYYEPSVAPEYQDIWVTVFGFSQADTSLILKVVAKDQIVLI